VFPPACRTFGLHAGGWEGKIIPPLPFDFFMLGQAGAGPALIGFPSLGQAGSGPALMCLWARPILAHP